MWFSLAERCCFPPRRVRHSKVFHCLSLLWLKPVGVFSWHQSSVFLYKTSCFIWLFKFDIHIWVCLKCFIILLAFLPVRFFNWSYLLFCNIPFQEQLGKKKKIKKKILDVNDSFPNCNFVGSILYIYDYEAICMKFTPFQISKIALLRKNPCTSQYHTD